MTAARTYVTGPPVWVTVHDDGRVTFEVDATEAAYAPGEYDADTMEMYDEAGQPFVPDAAMLEADAGRIAAAVAAGAQ